MLIWVLTGHLNQNKCPFKLI